MAEQFWQSDEVIGGGEEGEHGVGFFSSSDFELAQSGTGLGPAEDLFDTFSAALADLVAWKARGAAVDGALAPCAAAAELPATEFGTSRIEIILPEGICVRVDNQVGASALRQVMAVLRG